MKYAAFFIALCSFSVYADTHNRQLEQEIQQLREETKQLHTKLSRLEQQRLDQTKQTNRLRQQTQHPNTSSSQHHSKNIQNTSLKVHTIKQEPESVEFFPAALLADDHVVTYIAGMPVVTSPYLGAYPAFDGSDYIVNISSINRDLRLMQQRRRLYESFAQLDYPPPNLPIIALSGKVSPAGSIGQPFSDPDTDWSLGSSELDVAAAVNDKLEAYIGIIYDESPPAAGGPRVTNSALKLNMGFINIGDLDKTPYYFTAGQIYAPFGRFSTSMTSATLPLRLSRVKSRPFILGYKDRKPTGPFAALYIFRSETDLNTRAAGGINIGYAYKTVPFHGESFHGEIGVSVLSSLNDSAGMQQTGSRPGTTFGGFSSVTNGNERVHKIPALDLRGTFKYGRYSLTTEWVTSLGRFRVEDLSYFGVGAQPQAAQIEVGATFMAFKRPSSVAAGFQWSQETLALNMPHQRINAVFNISIWKDTIQSLEYRHDINYKKTQFANGIAPPNLVNANTIGPGGAADAVLAQISAFF